jgi:hypothetical protein
MAIDREALRRDMELHREAIERRAEELAGNHAAIMADGRETLKRAKEAEPRLYTQPVFTPLVTKAAESAAAADMIFDEWVDVVAIALARTRDELRDEFRAAVEKAQALLRENIARLEGQLTTLTALLGEKPASKKRKS